MENIIFRRALPSEIPQIIAMQSDIFQNEQGIPGDDIEAFLKKDPICWCAESEGRLLAATGAWKEDGEVHWGRVVVIPAARRQHIGTKLARLSFQELFDAGVKEIHMHARDTTVKLVCAMGGKAVGEPHEFYGANVTPVLLTKDDFNKAQPSPATTK